MLFLLLIGLFRWWWFRVTELFFERQMKLFSDLNVLAREKNADYADGWRRHGLRGLITRIWDKYSRVENLAGLNPLDPRPREPLVKEESIRQALMDMINYASFAVLWLGEQEEQKVEGS